MAGIITRSDNNDDDDDNTGATLVDGGTPVPVRDSDTGEPLNQAARNLEFATGENTYGNNTGQNPVKEMGAAQNTSAGNTSAGMPASVVESGYQQTSFTTNNDTGRAEGERQAQESTAASESFLESLQEQKEKQQQNITEAEKQLRNYYNLQGQKSADRESLRNQYNLEGKRERLNELTKEVKTMKREIETADDIATLDKIDLEGQGTDSRIVNRNQNAIARQRTRQKLEQTADLRAKTATAEMFRGNIDLATRQINQAVKAKYKPIEKGIEEEKFFLERYDQKLDETQKKIADARERKLENQQTKIEDAKSLINEAVKSGYAKPDEVEKFNELTGQPQKQIELAREILGRKARANTTGDGFTLKEGEARFDAKGNQIASLGEDQAAGSGFTPRPNRNNNPGNLKLDGQEGATGQDAQGFAQFGSVEAGFQALKRDLKAKATGNTAHGLGPESTIQELAEEYAPKEDGNNPTVWANNVAGGLGVSTDAKIGNIMENRPDQMARAVANAEGFEFGQSGQKPRQEYSKEVTAIAEQMKKDNNFGLENVDKDRRDKVALAAKDMDPVNSNQAVEKALGLFRTAEALQNHPALGAATGPMGQYVPSPRSLGDLNHVNNVLNELGMEEYEEGSVNDFTEKMNRLTNTQALEKLDQLPGQVSDNDIKLVKDAVNDVGYGSDTQEVKNALERVKTKAKKTLENAELSEEQAQIFLDLKKGKVQEVKQLMGTTDTSTSSDSFNPESFYGSN
jgi:hypothetical protein